MKTLEKIEEETLVAIFDLLDYKAKKDFIFKKIIYDLEIFIELNSKTIGISDLIDKTNEIMENFKNNNFIISYDAIENINFESENKLAISISFNILDINNSIYTVDSKFSIDHVVKI